MKLVKDYMKTKVVCFSPEDSVFKVAKVLAKKGISGGPVVKGETVLGVISETDIVRFMRLNLPELTDLVEPHSTAISIVALIKHHLDFRREIKRLFRARAKDVMSKHVISISPDQSLLEAANLMEREDIRRLLVIEKGKLVGIISRTDLLRALID